MRDDMLQAQEEAEQTRLAEERALLHLASLLEQWMDGDVTADDVVDDLMDYLIFR